MELSPFYPLHDDGEMIERFCKLPLHVGTAVISPQRAVNHPLASAFEQFRQGSGQPEPDCITFESSFIVPATGNCLIFLRSAQGIRLNKDFGENLVVTGDAEGSSFRLECSNIYVKATSSSRERPSWSIASPVNCFATVSYGEARPCRKVVAVINNFDFESGNADADNGPSPDLSARQLLRVVASGRNVDFAWRPDHKQLLTLLTLGVMNSASLTTFSFDARDGESEAELADLADNIASFCGIVARQFTGIAVLSFLDDEGRPIKRRIGNPIESHFRSDYVLRFLQFELPKLFQQSFDEFVRIQKTELWNRMSSFCASIEDSVFLEQMLTNVMAGVELLIRNSLIESNLPAEETKIRELPKLIGAARKHLGWNIPKHYTERERYRDVRNAGVHGDDLPLTPAMVRREFDKWSLLLFRRLFVRLGYDGSVASPFKGFASDSSVSDFSQEHNEFIYEEFLTSALHEK